jgi:hypothetical protein
MMQERRRVRLYFHLGLLLLVLSELFSVSGLIIAPHRLLRVDPNTYSPFLSFAVGSLFVTHLILLGRGSALRAAGLIGGILFTLHCALFQPRYPSLVAWAGLLMYFLGLGSLLLLGLQAWLQRGTPESKCCRFVLRAGLLPALFVMLSWPFLENTAQLNIATYDSVLLHFDGSLGFQPSLSVGRLFLTWPALATLCQFIYAVLPLAIALLYAWQCRCGRNASTLHAFVIAGLIGSALYLACPAAGPRYLLGDAFPLRVPELDQLLPAPRHIAPAFLNAMPSLHMAWALLLWFGLRSHAYRLRVLAMMFILLTVLATLGIGEHYLVDLVVALPLALLEYALAKADMRRRSPTAMLLAALLVLAWLLYLRSGVEHFAEIGRWHWLPIIATVCIALWPFKRQGTH